MPSVDTQKYESSLHQTAVQSSGIDRMLDGAAMLFHLVPKNFASWLTGALARVRWPYPLRQLVHKGFVRAFAIDMSEAELPLAQYRSIEEVFTRKLKPGARKIQGSYVSPADGTLVRSEALRASMAVQAKSFVYEIHRLLGQADPLSAGDCAWYQTIYLAPHNYHRVHAPCSGVVERLGVIPGDLWPVNVPFVERIPRLFTRNERLVFKIKQKEGGTVWVVMVGAFNVGRMTSPLAPFLVTNSDFGQSYPSSVWTEPNIPINVGDELGTFMLGSTVILVLDEEAIRSRGEDAQMVATVTKTTVQMGQSLVRGN